MQTKVSIHEKKVRKYEMGVLDMAAMSKSWEQFAFSCERADISGYFAANLVVPDEMCLSDGSCALLALSKLTSQPQGAIRTYRDTKSMRHRMYVNGNRKNGF